MGVVATNVLKEVCKEYSDEIEMQEASITEILVLQEQVKMELLSNKNLTNFWPDATLPVGEMVEFNNNSSEIFKNETMTIEAPP